MNREHERKDGGEVVGERVIDGITFTLIKISQEDPDEVKKRDKIYPPQLRTHGHNHNPNDQYSGRTTGAKPAQGVDPTPPKQH